MSKKIAKTKKEKIVVFIDPDCSGLQVVKVPLEQSFKETLECNGIGETTSSDVIYGVEIVDGQPQEVMENFS